MAERRPLTEGLKTAPPAPAVDPHIEHEFVRSAKIATPVVQPAVLSLARVPISSRIRADFADALKRASLERQLHKVEPNTLQDILEAAIEPWLRSNGYIS